MRIVVEIPIDGEGPRSIKELMDCLIGIWGRYLARNPFPKLYAVRPRYQQEPNAGEYEVWKSPAQTFESGWGDCDDLVLWRGAELVAIGEDASCQCQYVRGVGTLRMHVKIRRGDRRVEDPSVEVERR